MEILLAVLGVSLILIALVDALWTTLWVDGAAGPVTSRWTTWAWRGMRRALRGRHQALSLSGPVILMGTVMTWVLMLGTGWVLVLASDGDALESTTGAASVGWIDRIWYVAYSTFTLGNGDYVPAEGGWQLASALIAITGMSTVTLAITYLLSVVSAVVDKRAFASSVHSLGSTGADVVLNGWDGTDLHALDRQIGLLSNSLSQLTERYLAYPVLQYYHAAQSQKSPALALSVLDEALTLVHVGVQPRARAGLVSIAACRATVDTFLETPGAAFVEPADTPPPLPSLARLRDAGIPTVSEDEFESAVASFQGRRRALAGMVEYTGWTWWEA